jgi:hypothetical protein
MPGIVLMGFGVGNVWLPMTMAATGNVDAERQGLASGLVNTSQQIGGALGLAALSTIASGHGGSPEATVEGFTLAFAAGAGILLAALLVLAVWLRREDVDVGPESDRSMVQPLVSEAPAG